MGPLNKKNNNLVLTMKDLLWKNLKRYYRIKNTNSVLSRGSNGSGGLSDKYDDECNEYNHEQTGDAPPQKKDAPRTRKRSPWYSVSRALLFVLLLFFVFFLVLLVRFYFNTNHTDQMISSVPLMPLKPHSSSPLLNTIGEGGNLGVGLGGSPIFGMTPVSPSIPDMENIDNEKKRKRIYEASRKYLLQHHKNGYKNRGSYQLPITKQTKIYSWEEREKEEDPNDLTMALPYNQLQLVGNSGGGNCLFLCYQSMLESVGQTVTVEELRTTVANSMTQDQFQVLHNLYHNARKERDREILQHCGFMAGVDSLEELKEVMKTRKYYGDETSLNALEEKYGVVGIVLSLDRNHRVTLGHRFYGKNVHGDTPCGLLMLADTHYEHFILKGKVVTPFKDLPPKIVRLMKSSNAPEIMSN